MITTVTRLRCALITATAVWLTVVGTGASLVHSHGDEPGDSTPHRHLILFGVECPAEAPADGDGSDLCKSSADSHDTLVEVVGVSPATLICDSIVSAPAALPRTAEQSRTLRLSHACSVRTNRCAVLRA